MSKINNLVIPSVEGGFKEMYNLPEDTYNAVCIGVYSVGYQKKEFIKGQVEYKPEFYFLFETDKLLPEGHDKAGKRAVQGHSYTHSADPRAKLPEVYKAATGETLTWKILNAGLDPDDFIGKPFMITIGYSDSDTESKFPKIRAVAKHPGQIGGVKIPILKPENDVEEIATTPFDNVQRMIDKQVVVGSLMRVPFLRPDGTEGQKYVLKTEGVAEVKANEPATNT